jgi:hypothetical protein
MAARLNTIVAIAMLALYDEFDTYWQNGGYKKISDIIFAECHIFIVSNLCRQWQSRSKQKKSLDHTKSMAWNNLVPWACDPREGTWGSGIIRCRKPGILAKIELRIPFQRPIRFLPETDYPRASRSFPRIAGSGNEIGRGIAWAIAAILAVSVARVIWRDSLAKIADTKIIGIVG